MLGAYIRFYSSSVCDPILHSTPLFTEAVPLNGQLEAGDLIINIILSQENYAVRGKP